ncbi:MAG: 4-alpha-glucanotransferase [Candidatus Aureabacteria bacterium]|nr:4-alpha-glucanotransferase [Candidatus Auribacterota bacterium]
MKMGRKSGVLLHPTSICGKYGIGDLGPEAYHFVDFLHDSGQKLWQVLPLNPTGYGESPYQCYSAFAGNIMLISPDVLIEDGLLKKADIAAIPDFTPGRVDFEKAKKFKMRLLRKAYDNFKKAGNAGLSESFDLFCRDKMWWLEDFALFMAFKNLFSGTEWNEWEKGIAFREKPAIDKKADLIREEIESQKFWQYIFFRQWLKIKDYCREKGIGIIGDIPIFVSHDSADVWSHPELFRLDGDGYPLVVAGVPPDYFSATGQLWGNPIYNWEKMKDSNYQWWVDRFKNLFELVDIVRLDHFRGFEAYWEVPADEETAVNGKWVKGPGEDFFNVLKTALGEIPVIAENLGFITSEVEALRAKYGFPGMAILQFAFGRDSHESTFRPHMFERNLAAYTGTHDNNTVIGWWKGGKHDSTRSMQDVKEERQNAGAYLNTDGTDINWAFIRALMVSVADFVIFPLQDILGLGSEARMNTPSTSEGNWGWRYTRDMLKDSYRKKLKDFCVIYGR